jgi:hypothetical protein
MLEYQYDKDGYYVGEAENPGSIPSHNCTFIEPVISTGVIPRWEGADWTQIENHRGETVWIDGVETEITEYGPYPDGASLTPPPPTLAETKAAKLKEINRAKWTAIEQGEVEYGGLRHSTGTQAQNSIMRATTEYQLSGALPPLWKGKDGVLESPTIDQLTAISTAMYNYMEARFEREVVLAAQINAAGTVEEVEAIVWA